MMRKPIDVQLACNVQLEQFYRTIQQEGEHKARIRNWIITLILAYLTILGSGKIHVSEFNAHLTVTIIILIFWLMEGIHQSYITINQHRIRLIEEFLAQETLPASFPLELSFISGHDRVSFKEKIKTYFICVLTYESILFFYLALMCASYLLVYIEFSLK